MLVMSQQCSVNLANSTVAEVSDNMIGIVKRHHLLYLQLDNLKIKHKFFSTKVFTNISREEQEEATFLR